jgi:hypothetical protein
MVHFGHIEAKIFKKIFQIAQKSVLIRAKSILFTFFFC